MKHISKYSKNILPYMHINVKYIQNADMYIFRHQMMNKGLI